MKESDQEGGAPQNLEPTVTSDGMSRATLPGPPLASAVPRIDRYRILRKLGEGGMGVVYEAEQQEPRRLVALKVVRGGEFVDEGRVRMFKREAETLARLDHPGIGRIHESGRTEDGQHFFAMELVRGPTLGEYLRGRPPVDGEGELRFRLSLLRKIAGAVHYAHQRSVIHRDLKPSNIIVAAEAAAPSADEVTHTSSGIDQPDLPDVKILDFGLARITEGDIQATQVTEVGVIKGTLPYMSPEQARGSADQIDLRTDIYALGVLLYQMLADRLPYDVSGASLPDAVRVICEARPRPLAATLRTRLDPDVETIVGKALEKDADRRYASAAALAEDLGRYLSSQPIAARPPSAFYQLRKFAVRNKAIVAGACTAVAALLAGVVLATSFGLREAQQRREAQSARADLAKVAAFQQDMLERIDVAAMGRGLFDDLRGRLDAALAAEGAGAGERAAALRGLEEGLRRLNSTDVARQALDRGVLEQAQLAIETELGDQPRIQAELTQTLGTTSLELGLDQRAEALLREAVRAHDQQGDSPLQAASARRSLATLLLVQTRFEEAEALLREARATHAALLDEDDPAQLDDLSALALLHREKQEFAKSAALYEAVVARRERIEGPEARRTLHDRDGLAFVYVQQDRHEEAEAIQLDLLERARRAFGEQSNEYMRPLNHLAINYVGQGRLDEAASLYREELASSRARLGNDHRETHVSITNLGRLYLRMGRFEEAEGVLSESVSVGRRVLGPTEFGMAVALETHAQSLIGLERHAEAEAPLQEAWGIFLPLVGEEHPACQAIATALAKVYRRLGDETEAARWSAKVKARR